MCEFGTFVLSEFQAALALKVSQNKTGHATGKNVTQLSLSLRLVTGHQKDCVIFFFLANPQKPR